MKNVVAPTTLSASPEVLWARAVLSAPHRYVIIDTETTGCDSTSEIVQIAAIDITGNVLIDTLVRPLHTRRMPPGAEAVHGISMKDLKGAPTWTEVAEQIETILRDKIVLAYNAEYDERLVRQTAAMYQRPLPRAERWQCVMLKYSAFVGEPSLRHRGEYKWQKLPGAVHGAVGDCQAALTVIKSMADSAGSASASSQPASSPSVTRAPSGECVRCGGSGVIGKFSHIQAGRCFACNGTGKLIVLDTSRSSGATRLVFGLAIAFAVSFWVLAPDEPVTAAGPAPLAPAPVQVERTAQPEALSEQAAPKPRKSRARNARARRSKGSPAANVAGRSGQLGTTP